MPRVLIVAYGNPLRSDDGVAWRAADLLTDKFPASDVQMLRLHQLTPEVADSLREFDQAIFIDAASKEEADGDPGTVQVDKVDGGVPEPPSFSHTFSPQRLLGLSEQLYGSRPRAFVVTVTGANFNHGDSLSSGVVDALPELISAVERIVRDATSKA